MIDWTQIIVAALGGGAITAGISKINLLKADKRKGEAEAEKQELENDDLRFEGLKATVDDLNARLVEALARMRELEDALNKSNAKVIELKNELLQSQATIKSLQIEIGSLKEENQELKDRLGL